MFGRFCHTRFASHLRMILCLGSVLWAAVAFARDVPIGKNTQTSMAPPAKVAIDLIQGPPSPLAVQQDYTMIVHARVVQAPSGAVQGPRWKWNVDGSNGGYVVQDPKAETTPISGVEETSGDHPVVVTLIGRWTKQDGTEVLAETSKMISVHVVNARVVAVSVDASTPTHTVLTYRVEPAGVTLTYASVEIPTVPQPMNEIIPNPSGTFTFWLDQSKLPIGRYQIHMHAALGGKDYDLDNAVRHVSRTATGGGNPIARVLTGEETKGAAVESVPLQHNITSIWDLYSYDFPKILPNSKLAHLGSSTVTLASHDDLIVGTNIDVWNETHYYRINGIQSLLEVMSDQTGSVEPPFTAQYKGKFISYDVWETRPKTHITAVGYLDSLIFTDAYNEEYQTFFDPFISSDGYSIRDAPAQLY